MLTNLACSGSRLRRGMGLNYGTEITLSTDSAFWHRKLKRCFWR